MAKAKKATKCAGRKANGQLKKGYKNKKGGGCPVPVKKKARKARKR